MATFGASAWTTAAPRATTPPPRNFLVGVMSLTQCYPAFPPIERGKNCPLKTDKTGEKLLYPSGNTLVIRDAEPSADGKIGVMIYTEHLYTVTSAAMSPSGCYIASGDERGNLRVWACDTPDQILKLETPLFAGPVKDIAWSADSQRILGVGGSGQLFGKVIMWDSGNSVGDISGHSKMVNSCAFKPTRPFRLATGGEDGKVNFYEGPPFKWKATCKTHDRFVNVTRFSPDGARCVLHPLQTSPSRPPRNPRVLSASRVLHERFMNASEPS